MGSAAEEYLKRRRSQGSGSSDSSALLRALAGITPQEPEDDQSLLDKAVDIINPFKRIPQALGYGSRAVASTVKELQDLAFVWDKEGKYTTGGEGFEYSAPSLRDWLSQVNDESWGWGDLWRESTGGFEGVTPGGLWIDRTAGVVGEVGGDPLSFLGTAGAASLARGGAKGLGKAASREVVDKSLELGARRGDDVAREVLNRLKDARGVAKSAAEGTDDVAKQAAEAAVKSILDEATPLITSRGYRDEVLEGIDQLTRRGGGATAVRTGDVAETLIGEGTSGLRVRPFWKNEGGKMLVSQERWSDITKPIRAVRGRIAETSGAQKVLDRWGDPLTRWTMNQIGRGGNAARTASLLAGLEAAEDAIGRTGSQRVKLMSLADEVDNLLGKDENARRALFDVVGTPDGEAVDVATQIARLEAAGASEAAGKVRAAYQMLLEIGDAELPGGVGNLFQTYQPIRLSAEAMKDVKSGKVSPRAAFQYSRNIRTKFMGEDVPSIAEAIRSGRATINPDGTIKFTDPAGFNWTKYFSEIDRIAKNKGAKSVYEVLEMDPVRLLRLYTNELFRQLELNRVEIAFAKHIGQGFAEWKLAGRLEELLSTHEGKMGKAAERVSKAAARIAALADEKIQLDEQRKALESSLAQPLTDAAQTVEQRAARVGLAGDTALRQMDEIDRAILANNQAMESAIGVLESSSAQIARGRSPEALDVAEQLGKIANQLRAGRRPNAASVENAAAGLTDLAGEAAPAVNNDVAGSTAAWLDDQMAPRLDDFARAGNALPDAARADLEATYNQFLDLRLQIKNTEKWTKSAVRRLQGRMDELIRQAKRQGIQLDLLDEAERVALQGEAAARAAIGEVSPIVPAATTKRDLLRYVDDLAEQVKKLENEIVGYERGAQGRSFVEAIQANPGPQLPGQMRLPLGERVMPRTSDDMIRELTDARNTIEYVLDQLVVFDGVPDLGDVMSVINTERRWINKLRGEFAKNAVSKSTEGRALIRSVEGVLDFSDQEIAQLVKLKDELGGELPDLRWAVRRADAIARTASRNRDQLEAMAARGGPKTREVAASGLRSLDEAEAIAGARDELIASVAADVRPAAVMALDVAYQGKVLEATLTRLSKIPSMAENAANSARRNEELMDAMQTRLAKAVESEVLRSTLEKDYGFLLRQGIAAGVVLPDTLVDAIQNAYKFEQLPEWLRYMDKFNQWFKGYSTLTPGFHVRNYYSGAWSNFIAGVPLGTQTKFGKEYYKWVRGKDVPKEYSDFFDLMVKEDMFNVGQFLSETSDFAKSQTTWLSLGPKQRLIYLNRRGGNHVENILRGSLAFHIYTKNADRTADAKLSLMRSGVNMYHFDYSKLSQFEKKAARLIPFYTWTARNVPLQLELLAHKPQYVTNYFRVRDSINESRPEDPFKPDYFDELLAINTGISIGDSEMYLTPDMPFRSAMEIIGKASDPVRLATSATPLIKSPIEMATDRDLFTGQDLKGRTTELPGTWKFLEPFLKAAGWAEDDAMGRTIIEADKARALESLAPLLGRTRRLVPTEDKYQDRLENSWLTVLGIPAKGLTDSERLGQYRYQQSQGRTREVTPDSERRREERRNSDMEEMQLILARAGIGS